MIAIGPGIFTQTGDRIKMTCKVGDVVLLHARLLKGDNQIELDKIYVPEKTKETVFIEGSSEEIATIELSEDERQRYFRAIENSLEIGQGSSDESAQGEQRK